MAAIIGSPDTNKVLKKILFPVLKEKGFVRHQLRRCWAHHNNCVWVVDIKSVGKYFSDVSGWPPGSIIISLGILYLFYDCSLDIKIDDTGVLLPTETLCHRRTSLLIRSPSILQYALNNEAEHTRRDIWWISGDGSNLEESVISIKDTFVNEGLSWFFAHSNKADADSSIGNGKQLLELEREKILINYLPPYLNIEHTC